MRKPISLQDKQTKWVLRLIALVVTVLCINTLRNTGEPNGLYRMVIRAIVSSFVLNAALWLSTFRIGLKLRYLLALYLIPAAFGVAFLMTNYFLLIGTLVFHSWLIVKLLKEKLNNEITYNIKR